MSSTMTMATKYGFVPRIRRLYGWEQLEDRRVLASNTVIIDTDWLSQQGDAPYVLATPDTTYELATDIVAPRTAIVIGAPNVTLDLNGHTITYQDADPVSVPNAGFESPLTESGAIPNWDLSGAPTAELSSSSFLFGEKALQLVNFTSPQTIRSSMIRIPEVGHTYSVSMTFQGGTSITTADVLVIDMETGNTIGGVRALKASSGPAIVGHFEPTTTNPIQVEITVRPPAGQSSNIRLDELRVMRSYDYGILASSTWHASIAGFSNLSTKAQQHYAKAENFRVEGGTIQQGRGAGFGSHAMNFLSLNNGFHIDGLSVVTKGMDTMSVLGQWASTDLVVRNSTFTHGNVDISNRHSLLAALDFTHVFGNIIVENNTIEGRIQTGVTILVNQGREITIRNNRISHESPVTNGYGIVLVGVDNFTIEGNRITPVSGRGIMIDGWTEQPSRDGIIRHNYVDAQERGNREYGTQGIEVRALRLRRFSNGGAHQRILIDDNDFIARTGSGLAVGAYAVSFSYGTATDMEGIVLRGNRLQAITTDKNREAVSLVFAGMPAGVGLRIEDNLLASNHIGVRIGDKDGADVGNYDVQLVSHKISRIGPRIDGLSFRSVSLGWWINESSDFELVNTRYADGAPARIAWGGSGAKEIRTAGLVDVSVTDANVVPVSGAQVRIMDRLGNIVFDGLTDQAGKIATTSVATTVARQTGQSPAEIDRESLGPFRITVSRAGFADADISSVELSDLENNLRIDLSNGVIRDTASIDGIVFEDIDANGTQGANEPSINGWNDGWTVFLDTDNDGQLDDSERRSYTDVNGRFQFNFLPAGNYRVRLSRLDGSTVTTSDGTGQQTTNVSANESKSLSIGARIDFVRYADEVRFNGTNLDDTVEFLADDSSFRVDFNGREYTFEASESTTSFRFEDSGGNDSITVTGREGTPDVARINVTTLGLGGDGYVVTGEDFESIRVQGHSNDNDVAYLFDSLGDDEFQGSPNLSVLTGFGFRNEIASFRRVYTIAQSGGHDVAMLEDSISDDVFEGNESSSIMYGTGYRLNVSGFDSVTANSLHGGNDRANLIGTSGSDFLTSNILTTELTTATTGNRITADRFKSVSVQGKGGDDAAILSDNPVNDHFRGNGSRGHYFDLVHQVEIENFGLYLIYSTRGGWDTFHTKPVDYVFYRFGAWLDPKGWLV